MHWSSHVSLHGDKIGQILFLEGLYFNVLIFFYAVKTHVFMPAQHSGVISTTWVMSTLTEIGVATSPDSPYSLSTTLYNSGLQGRRQAC